MIDLYKNNFEEDLLFTTGENQKLVQNKMSSKDIKGDYVFNKSLEYEINAAINFELCCRANKFIGLTRSTFSNLISLKRVLINKNQSYIYNLNNEIYLRVDKGLHPDPENAINNQVQLV